MRRALILLLVAAPLQAMIAPSMAQSLNPSLNPSLIPPEGPGSAALAQELAARGIDTEMTYAASARDIERPRPAAPQQEARMTGAGASTWWVLGGLALALALWLRFGGAGLLVRRAPEEGGKIRPPDHWQVETLAPASLLDEIAAMEDRTAALVRLLRHCLLRAAEETRTRLARSDTERQAFRRLPAAPPGLGQILQTAELAHYGGRPVSPQGFAEALQLARGLLGSSHG